NIIKNSLSMNKIFYTKYFFHLFLWQFLR
ncbi:type-1 secretion protein, partial [Salmonella enterica]|nr:type-1 secretion protein [Salmonella enterica]